MLLIRTGIALCWRYGTKALANASAVSGDVTMALVVG